MAGAVAVIGNPTARLLHMALGCLS